MNMCTSGPARHGCRVFATCPQKDSPLGTTSNALAAMCSSSTVIFQVAASLLFVFHQWPTEGRLNGGRSLLSLFFIKGFDAYLPDNVLAVARGIRKVSPI